MVMAVSVSYMTPFAQVMNSKVVVPTNCTITGIARKKVVTPVVDKESDMRLLTLAPLDVYTPAGG